jgi:Protein of unknown function (DUF1073)
MSGSDIDNGPQSWVSVGSRASSVLMQLLDNEDIVPGSSPSYEICKTLYTYHPLGAKMTEGPVAMAQSQEREIQIPGSPEEDLIQAFQEEWNRTGEVGANTLIKNVMTMSRIYGIASVVAVSPDVPPEQPLDPHKLHELELYYNVLDPLNTAGSLVLEQDPNALDFMKPRYVTVMGKQYHPSRTAIIMNEQPIYIEWTNSSFGFVGRSVYQRAFYPLKSYIQSMITDDSVTSKAALLVAMLESPGSILDNRALAFFNFKRQQIKGGRTGNVLSVGKDERIESLDLKNVRDAAEFARNNILKNIATAAQMPAALLDQETFARGLAEGTEDAKNIARFIDGVRIEMAPIYRFFDNIVMHRAWNPAFYKSLQRKYPDIYGNVKYRTAFYKWKNAFKTKWPNLLEEPDSEKIKVDDIVSKAAIATFEVLAPALDPENKAVAAGWLADVMNERQFMFSAPLQLDLDLLKSYEPPVPETEPKPTPESSRT